MIRGAEEIGYERENGRERKGATAGLRPADGIVKREQDNKGEEEATYKGTEDNSKKKKEVIKKKRNTQPSL